MRNRLAFSASVLLGAVLLTACGTEVSGTQHSAGAGPGSTTAARCGFPADPAAAAADGVAITAVSGSAIGCAASAHDRVEVGFQVTNHGAQPVTYTVEFEVIAPSGEALTNASGTVQGVKPGASAAATAEAGVIMRHGAGAHVKIYRVRSVPADEAPAASGTCPASGVRVHADEGDAAMGLRVVGLHLENCSKRPYRLSGFPQIQLLDLRHRPVTGVSVLHGSGGISSGTDFDKAPRAMTLQPGERASSGLMWRNTVTDGAAVDVPYVRVVAQPGTHAVTVTPELDLGTTGKLGVSPWQKDKR
jgi:hypothetical protein